MVFDSYFKDEETEFREVNYLAQGKTNLKNKKGKK